MDDFEAAFPCVKVEQTGFQSSSRNYVPRLLADDRCTKGSGFKTGPTLRLRMHDDEIIRNIYKDQEAFLSTDARQLTEFSARGSYPISLCAVSKPILLDLLAQDIAKSVLG